MNGRALDETHDLCVKGTGVARNTQWSYVVAQRVETMLKTFMGEAYVNRFYGIPWYDEILGESVLDIDHAQAVLKEKIMEVFGVKDVVSHTLDTKGRVLSGTFQIRCTDNTVVEGSY